LRRVAVGAENRFVSNLISAMHRGCQGGRGGRGAGIKTWIVSTWAWRAAMCRLHTQRYKGFLTAFVLVAFGCCFFFFWGGGGKANHLLIPALSITSTLHPLQSSCSVTIAWPHPAAKCKAVRPLTLGARGWWGCNIWGKSARGVTDGNWSATAETHAHRWVGLHLEIKTKTWRHKIDQQQPLKAHTLSTESTSQPASIA
jgi:hypothetical protein